MPFFKAHVKGFVQGVGYRYFAQRSADMLGVKGYVCNLPDGSVEVVAEGEKEILDSFLKSLARGPHFSQVEDVEVEWGSEDQGFTRFTIEH